MIGKKELEMAKDLLQNTDYIHPNTALQIIETLEEAVRIIVICNQECCNDKPWEAALDLIETETNNFINNF
jgi:hypothetical protein